MDETVVDESVIVMAVDTIVADGIAVADTSVAEDERRSNVVVETYLNTCVILDLVEGINVEPILENYPKSVLETL